MSELLVAGCSAVLDAYKAHRRQCPLSKGWAEHLTSPDETDTPVRLENASYVIDLRMGEADEWETDEDFRAYTAYVTRKDQVAPDVPDAVRTVQALLGEGLHVEPRLQGSDPYDGVRLDPDGKPLEYLLIERPSSDFLEEDPPAARLMLPLSIQFPPTFHVYDHGKILEDCDVVTFQPPREVQGKLPEGGE